MPATLGPPEDRNPAPDALLSQSVAVPCDL